MEVEKKPEPEIVKKGSKEYDEARVRYLFLFKKDQPEDMILSGNIGMKSKQAAALPMPWGCPRLEVYIWSGDGKPASFGFFCDICGCICEPCRADMDGTYPEACPEEGESSLDEDEEEDFDEWDEEDDNLWYS